MKYDDLRYRWKLEWDGSRYRGYYTELTWRHVWWIPVLLIIGPLTPALLAMAVYWLLQI